MLLLESHNMFNVKPSRVFSPSVNHSELQSSPRAKTEAEHTMGKVPRLWDRSHSNSNNKTIPLQLSAVLVSVVVWGILYPFFLFRGTITRHITHFKFWIWHGKQARHALVCPEHREGAHWENSSGYLWGSLAALAWCRVVTARGKSPSHPCSHEAPQGAGCCDHITLGLLGCQCPKPGRKGR